jgi:hypothetical protein
MKKYRYFLFLALLPVGLALVFLIPRIKAEPAPQQTPSSAMAELIEALKVWKLVDAVSPTSEQEAPLLAKFNKLEKLKAQYRQDYKGAINRLKQLQETTIDADAKKKELEAALLHYYQVEDNFINQRKQILDELNQILTVEQQAKFVVFSYTYRKDLKDTLQTLAVLQELRDKDRDVIAAESKNR